MNTMMPMHVMNVIKRAARRTQLAHEWACHLRGFLSGGRIDCSILSPWSNGKWRFDRQVPQQTMFSHSAPIQRPPIAFEHVKSWSKALDGWHSEEPSPLAASLREVQCGVEIFQAYHTLVGLLGRCVGGSDHTTVVLFLVVMLWGHVIHFNSYTFANLHSIMGLLQSLYCT